jgi:hypothetical protein
MAMDVLLVLLSGATLRVSEQTALSYLGNGKTRFTYVVQGGMKVFTVVSY